MIRGLYSNIVSGGVVDIATEALGVSALLRSFTHEPYRARGYRGGILFGKVQKSQRWISHQS